MYTHNSTQYFDAVNKSIYEYPESEREKVAQRKVLHFVSEAFANGAFLYLRGEVNMPETNRYERNRQCRHLYHNIVDADRYDYLYQKIEKCVSEEVDGMTIEQVITQQLPALVRNVPIVRPRIRAMISKEAVRPLLFRAYGIDETASQRKTDHLRKTMRAELTASIQLANQREQVAQQLEEMMQQLAQQQDPQSAQMLQQLQQQYGMVKLVSDMERIPSEERIQNIQHYYKYEHKDVQELNAERALHNYIEKRNLRWTFNQGMEEKMITDEEVYYVDWEVGMSEPVVRLIRPELMYYPYSDHANHVHELDFTVEYMPMTMRQMVEVYGHELVEDDIERIRQLAGLQITPSSVYLNQVIPRQIHTGYYNGKAAQQLSTYKVYWKENKKVYALIDYSEDAPMFLRYVEDDEVEALKKKHKGDKKTKLEYRYKNEVWEGIWIYNTDIFLNLGKKAYQYRTEPTLADAQLPYVGRNVSYFHIPNSLVWETKDIQELYNILHFKEELLVVLAGVKGIVYDISQKPEAMTLQEVATHMQQGLMFIETVQGQGMGMRKNSTFNQFQTYDQTLSPSIATIAQMKQGMEDLVGLITGINRQQIGEVVHTDQVGTTQIAMEQSNVVMESYMLEHEHLEEMVLTRLANMFTEAYKDGKETQFLMGDQVEALRLPANGLTGTYKVVVRSGDKEREKYQQAKQLAQLKLQGGQISASAYMEVLAKDTLPDMIRVLKMAEADYAKQQQGMQQSQQQMEQNKAQMEQQIAQYKGQLEMQKAQLDGQIKERENQVRLQIAQMQQAQVAQQLQQHAQVEQMKNATVIKGQNEEFQTEQGYLRIQAAQVGMNNRIQEAQLLIAQAQNHIKIKEVAAKSKVRAGDSRTND